MEKEFPAKTLSSFRVSRFFQSALSALPCHDLTAFCVASPLLACSPIFDTAHRKIFSLQNKVWQQWGEHHCVHSAEQNRELHSFLYWILTSYNSTHEVILLPKSVLSIVHALSMPAPPDPPTCTLTKGAPRRHNYVFPYMHRRSATYCLCSGTYRYIP